MGPSQMATPLYLMGSLIKLGQTRNPYPRSNNWADLSPNGESSYFQPKTKGRTPAQYTLSFLDA